MITLITKAGQRHLEAALLNLYLESSDSLFPLAQLFAAPPLSALDLWPRPNLRGQSKRAKRRAELRQGGAV